jgi:hypothetical protein
MFEQGAGTGTVLVARAAASRAVENRKHATYNQEVLFAGQKPNRIQRIVAGKSSFPGKPPAAVLSKGDREWLM